MVKTITYNNTYNDKPILAYPDYQLGCQVDILQSINLLFQHMLNKHSKVLFIRFDVRFPIDYPAQEIKNNKLFSRFIATLVMQYQRKRYDPHYLWVREQSDYSNHPHYHVVFLLNGHKAKYYMPVLEHATRLWGYQLNCNAKGLIFYCNQDRYGNPQENGICIRKDRPDYRKLYALFPVG